MSSRALVFIPGLAVEYYDCAVNTAVSTVLFIQKMFFVYRIAGSKSTDLLVEPTNPYI